MQHFFCPSSVVVIGVSTRPTNLGKEIARNLLEFNYNGEIHFVGANGGVLLGRRIHKTLDDIEGGIDLAIILTPAKTVPELVDACGKRGIKRIVIESGGFGELDEKGKDLGQELRYLAEEHGIRFIGPNCIGIMNSSNGLTTPFASLKNVFKKGGVGIIAQSGGVALSLLNMFDGEQIGFSKFAAIGNKLNVDENDFLQYYVQDPETKVICMYLESIGDGRRFMDISRSSDKPIILHKANIGSLSRMVARSHTDALANDDQTVDIAMRQCGVARFRNMQQYLDFVKVLQLPKIKGRKLAIISRSGGHAVIAADAAYTADFQLPPFEQDFLAEIRKHLRADVIQLANPLDLGDLFDFDVYVRIIEHTIRQPNIDAILFLHTYFASVEGTSSRTLLERIADLSYTYDKPVAMCISTEQFELSQIHKQFDFPIFLSPENAVFAMDAALKYADAKLVNKESGSMHVLPETRNESIAEVLKASKSVSGHPQLHEALRILEIAGLTVPDYRIVKDPAHVTVNEIGFDGPFALKVVAGSLSHKSDVGGVLLDVSGEQFSSFIERMFEKFANAEGFEGILVQRMVPRIRGSLEMIIGGKRDPQFGPVVLLGYGGIYVEVFGKISLRVAPVDDLQINKMIDELPGSELLAGIRGMPPVDRQALIHAIRVVSDLMVQFPEIESLDINPIQVATSGCIALDTRMYLA